MDWLRLHALERAAQPMAVITALALVFGAVPSASAAKPTELSVTLMSKLPKRVDGRQSAQRGLSYCFKACGKDKSGQYRKGLTVNSVPGSRPMAR